jgi:hypothetical protein
VVLIVPGLQSSNRASNERNASINLKVITSAEADFRSNDRDKNGVNDFWTGDVSGLYSLDVGDGPLKLIPREVAEADAAPLKPLVPSPVPFKGYLFRALEADFGATPRSFSWRSADFDYAVQSTGSVGRIHLFRWKVGGKLS